MKTEYEKEVQWRHHLISFLLFILFSGLVILMAFPLTGAEPGENVNDDQEHSVGVSAHLVPFYAEDAAGLPVFDLKAEEIELLVDNKRFPIMTLSQFRFDSIEETPIMERIKRRAQPSQKAKRYVFIIVDYMFNNRYGLLRAQKICNEIIDGSSLDEAFVIMENVPEQGLLYVAGPTPDRARLKAALAETTKKGLEIIQKQHMKLKDYGAGMYYGGNGLGIQHVDRFTPIDLHFQESLDHQLMASKVLKARALKFTLSLDRLHNALGSTTQPKLVYLVSMGVRNGILGESGVVAYFKRLKDIAQAINRNGGLLYVIDSSIQHPDLPKKYTGEESLRALADGGNGKYFSGNNLEELAHQVKKSTSAYYELAFSPNEAKRFNIAIRSIRPGVTIHTVSQSEKSTHYRQMKKIRKKLFALNVVTGGTWSRTEGTVKLLPFEKEQGAGADGVNFSVVLPEEIKNRPVDVYTINIDPKTQKADFSIKHLTGKEQIRLKGTRMDQRWLYFVIIEPQTATCLFNRVI